MKSTILIFAGLLSATLVLGVSPALARSTSNNCYLVVWSERHINGQAWSAMNMTPKGTRCVWGQGGALTATVVPAGANQFTVTIPGHICLVTAAVTGGLLTPTAQRCHKP